MVNHIDIDSLTLEELGGVVDIYPWYAGARAEFCRRMSQMGLLTEEQIEQSALYMASRQYFARILKDRVPEKEIIRDRDVDSQKPLEIIRSRPQVPGGDYFSSEQYRMAQQPQDNVFSKFAVKARQEGYVDQTDEREQEADFCTETLARIYLEQDYAQKAIEIYSKLSLRYPEKSIYFASLIEEIERKQNNDSI